MKTKICGITNLEDAVYCAEQGADALGFIFYEKSKRYIPMDKAKEIIALLPFFVIKIGVFVNESSNIINDAAKYIGLNGVQLHGDEEPGEILKLNLPTIKAFRVNKSFNFDILSDYSNCGILLDTYNRSEYGGSGKSFKWRIIPEEIRHKIILAGGISSANIEQVKKEISPAAVDLSSALESAPGIKNHDKVKEFMKKIKQLGETKC